jgi:hypothetical protein
MSFMAGAYAREEMPVRASAPPGSNDRAVTKRFGRRYEVSAVDLPRLMNAIVDQSDAGEERDVERLLGVLTSLAATEKKTIAFVAPRGTADLVDRALADLARSDRHQARARRARDRV